MWLYNNGKRLEPIMIHTGDTFIKRKTENGKVVHAVVISTDPEEEYLIQLEKKDGEKIFRHVEILKKHWYNLTEKGIQLKMFKQ